MVVADDFPMEVAIHPVPLSSALTLHSKREGWRPLDRET